SSSIQKTDFSILNGPEIDSFLLNNATTLTVKLAEALTQNQEYSLTVSGIDDIFGNSMPATEVTLKYVVSAPAESGDILISEFLYDQPSGYTEFIELYNSS